jgi:glycosyltransferase involved in cell wall biosynthesis
MERNTPVVSVIVPVYSVERYLQQCIDSICKQTYENLEVILVNDGSPDNCGEICDRNAVLDSRIVVIHKENGGLSSARNVGLDIAKGEYIAFVDADDTIHPCFIEKLLEMCLRYNCDIAQCDYLAVSEDSLSLPLNPWQEISFYDGRQALHELCRGGVNAIKYTVAWNKIYKRKLFRYIRYPVGRIHEDEFTTYQVFWKAKKIAITRQYLYYYLQRNTSIMGSGFSIKRLDILDAFRERLAFLQKKKLKENYFQTLQGLVGLLEKNYYLLQENGKENEAICARLLQEKESLEKFLPASPMEKEDKVIPWPLQKGRCPHCVNAKILLYGAGKWGQRYYRWIKEHRQGVMVGWVDNAWYSLQQEGLPVSPLDALLRLSYDYILIAITNKAVQEEIVQNFLYWGIPKEKILSIPSDE